MKGVRVGDIAEQVRGVTFAKSDASAVPVAGSVPVLTAGNIQNGQLILDALTYVPNAMVRDKQRVRKDDVLICASSGSLSVVGKAARSRGDFDGGFGAFLKALRPGPAVDPGYFSHFFQTPAYRRRVSSMAAGANINNLKNEHLDDLEIPLPSLAEQRRIAAILDRADALRAKRRQVLAQLAALTQSIFHAMFAGSTWPSKPLSAIVQPNTIVTYGIVQAGEEFDGGIPYIRTGDIAAGEIVTAGLRRTDPAIAARFQRSAVNAGDIVISIRATVGTTAVVPSALDGANLTQGTARIAPSDRAIGPYLLSYLRSSPAQRWIHAQVKGATFREITLGRLRELQVPLPPVSLQRQFADRSACVNSQIAHTRQALKVDDELFASLQSRAFRGEL